MELYLGSTIEPIRKYIRNMLYFNSKHVPKTLGEAMQKAQDLHIKHLYAIGEDQDSVASSSNVLPEITVNEVTSREDRRWYRNKRDFREHSQNSQGNVAAKERTPKESGLQPTVWDENYKQQQIQRFFSKFACAKQLFKRTGGRQVESTAKCNTWIFYANNGESDAVTGPPIHSMVR